MSLLRPKSTALTGGTANSVVSTGEFFGALSLGLASLRRPFVGAAGAE